MNCKHCQAPLEDGNSVCPSCGWDNSLPEETETIAFSPEETAQAPASYCCPVLACILLVPVVETCGRRIAWAWYGAVALLSCLLCPDPEAAALFLFLGYYPIIKGPLDRISPALLRALAKLALFLVACALMYTALLFVLSLEQVAETFRQEAPWMLAVGLALGILTFFLTDFLLTRLEAMWRRRTGKRSE